jgi:hypothetical protein
MQKKAYRDSLQPGYVPEDTAITRLFQKGTPENKELIARVKANGSFPLQDAALLAHEFNT